MSKSIEIVAEGSGRDTATVRELIEALQALDIESWDLPIETEGCDCLGDVASLTVDGERVLLCRS
jgi:hypothetical protein